MTAWCIVGVCCWQSKDATLVQDALLRLLINCYLQQPTGHRIGDVPLLMTAFDCVVVPASSVLPEPVTSDPIDATRAFITEFFERVASSPTFVSATVSVGLGMYLPCFRGGRRPVTHPACHCWRCRLMHGGAP